MKRSTGPDGTSANGNGSVIRTTIVITEALDANLGIVAARRGVSKSELFRKAAEELVRGEKLDPTKQPKRVLVEY